MFELLAGFGALFAGLHLIDARAGIVEFGQHAALLFFEAFELATDFFAFDFIGRGGEGGLELLQSVIEVVLAAGEFLESSEDVELFTLLGRGGGFGFALASVVVLILAEAELIEL